MIVGDVDIHAEIISARQIWIELRQFIVDTNKSNLCAIARLVCSGRGGSNDLRVAHKNDKSIRLGLASAGFVLASNLFATSAFAVASPYYITNAGGTKFAVYDQLASCTGSGCSEFVECEGQMLYASQSTYGEAVGLINGGKPIVVYENSSPYNDYCTIYP